MYKHHDVHTSLCTKNLCNNFRLVINFWLLIINIKCFIYLYFSKYYVTFCRNKFKFQICPVPRMFLSIMNLELPLPHRCNLEQLDCWQTQMFTETIVDSSTTLANVYFITQLACYSTYWAMGIPQYSHNYQVNWDKSCCHLMYTSVYHLVFYHLVI